MLCHEPGALKVEAEIVPVERIVEDIGRVERCVADKSVRVDGEPAARSPDDVLMVNIAM
jgi:hypothetical protein